MTDIKYLGLKLTESPPIVKLLAQFHHWISLECTPADSRFNACVFQNCVSLSHSQLTSGMIEELDSLLHTGTEITAIYEELTKTLPSDHLEFTTVRASSRAHLASSPRPGPLSFSLLQLCYSFSA